MKKFFAKFKIHRIVYAILDLTLVYLVYLLGSLGAANYSYFSTYIYIGVVAILIVCTFLIFKVYKIITTQIGIVEALKIGIITFAVSVAGYISTVILHYVGSGIEIMIPWYRWLFIAVVLCFALPTIRLTIRVCYSFYVSLNKKDPVRTILIGAGEVASILINETRRNPNNNNKVVALVDDDASKIGGMLSNIPVEGPINNIESIITKYNAEEVVIAISNLSDARLQEILHILFECPVRVKRAPLLSEMNGPHDTRIMNIDINELLSRKPNILDNSEIKTTLAGKCVMVTGAGGSIGSELVRQIFAVHPKTLVLFDIYENATYDIQMELVRKMRNEHINDIELVTLIGSTYNAERMEQVISKYRPDYIYHAAAYKHVPLMEDSPQEAIRTNVVGTYNVARLADKYGVTKMVLVSTDKAVRPTNAMGATKRFAETIIQYFASKSEHTHYAAVRFGNVLGSNGSVVPLFKKQIEAGGPVTLTHKDIIRYFMTIPEAVSLILQCGLFADKGEIFILDMGKPVKIMDLAEKMIRQAGYVPNKDIMIVETGLRPGEKLYEELLVDTTSNTRTSNERIFIEDASPIMPIEDEIKQISEVFHMTDVVEIKDMLASIITTYKVDK